MTRQTLAIALLVPFGALTVYAVAQVGLGGILGAVLAGPGAWQVGADLVVALALVLSFLVPDARRRGRSPWPWVLATAALGSIGPLLYLATVRGSGVGSEAPAAGS